MDIYNEAFRFLLQIKRVKYSLDGLKFVGKFIEYCDSYVGLYSFPYPMSSVFLTLYVHLRMPSVL